jgi:hypothetical protein
LALAVVRLRANGTEVTGTEPVEGNSQALGAHQIAYLTDLSDNSGHRWILARDAVRLRALMQ